MIRKINFGGYLIAIGFVFIISLFFSSTAWADFYHCCSACVQQDFANQDQANSWCQTLRCGSTEAVAGTCDLKVTQKYHCCTPCQEVTAEAQNNADGVALIAAFVLDARAKCGSCSPGPESGPCAANEKPGDTTGRKCGDTYPAGKGDGQCMPAGECTPKTEWKNKASVQVIGGQELCQVSGDRCCVYVGELNTVGSKGASASTLQADAASRLNLAKITDPSDLIKRAINLLLAFIGSIALALYVWAGFTWMTAAGEEKKIDSAKKIVVWTSLGVLVMLLSYTLVNFVIKAIK